MESAHGPSLLAHYLYIAGIGLFILSLLADLYYGLYYYYVFYYSKNLQPLLPMFSWATFPQWLILPKLTFPMSNFQGTTSINDSALFYFIFIKYFIISIINYQHIFNHIFNALLWFYNFIICEVVNPMTIFGNNLFPHPLFELIVCKH